MSDDYEPSDSPEPGPIQVGSGDARITVSGWSGRSGLTVTSTRRADGSHTLYFQANGVGFPVDVDFMELGELRLFLGTA